MEQLYRELIKLQEQYDAQIRVHNAALMDIRIRANAAVKESKVENILLIEKSDLTSTIELVAKRLSNKYLEGLKNE